MNKTFRIKTEVGGNADNHIKLRLEQEVDTFEILSLKINQADIYDSFNCDHGVLVGRVNANNGVGIPNAKVSIFIPITDEDKTRPDIVAIYPYETPRDKNLDEKRYNLLPRVATERLTGEVKPRQPFGSFPTKQEVITNPTYLEVYKKYYKYSTVTNESGDYMLFGVPTGTQTVHMSVDTTDIGRFSMTPATLVTNLGYSPNLFVDNGTRIKESDDLEDLPNIETQEITVDIIPFCGDEQNFDIGITRQDFRIRAELLATFTLFGTSFSDGDDHAWGGNGGDTSNTRIRELYYNRNRLATSSMGTKRAVNIREKVYSINNNITDAEIDADNFDPRNDVTLLDSTQYSSFKRNGDFVYIIPCNRKKIITNEQGEDVVVQNEFRGGAFTEFRGFIIFEYSEDDAPLNFSDKINNNGRDVNIVPLRLRYKFPQSAQIGKSFDEDSRALDNTNKWRRQNYKFEFNKFYSVAKFQPTVQNTNTNDDQQDVNQTQNTLVPDIINSNDGSFNSNYQTGLITTINNDDDSNTDVQEFPNNVTRNNGDGKFFMGNWINFAIHFQQFMFATTNRDRIRGIRSATNTFRTFEGEHFYFDNSQEIAGGDINTKNLARSDLHYTDFINVPFEDIQNILENTTTRGFLKSNISSLSGTYRNGQTPCPINGGRINSDPTQSIDPETYFYKGILESDCFQYLRDLGLV